MPFLTPLRVEKVLFKDIWILLKEFVYHHAPTEFCSLDVTITVPVGFWTDFASFPIVPLAVAQEAATIHDFLYRCDSDPLVDKDTADRIFFDALCESGVSIHHAAVMFDAVHLGGTSSYHKKYVKDKIGD